MSSPNPNNVSPIRPQRAALERWDGEGGAGPDGPQQHDVVENLIRYDTTTIALHWAVAV